MVLMKREVKTDAFNSDYSKNIHIWQEFWISWNLPFCQTVINFMDEKQRDFKGLRILDQNSNVGIQKGINDFNICLNSMRSIKIIMQKYVINFNLNKIHGKVITHKGINDLIICLNFTNSVIIIIQKGINDLNIYLNYTSSVIIII